MKRKKQSELIRKKILDGTFVSNLPKIPWNKNKKYPQMIGNVYGFKLGHTPWNKNLIRDNDSRISTGDNLVEHIKKHGAWNKNLTGEDYIKHYKNGKQSFARKQLKGKTYEEIYGPEKAKEQREKRSKTIKLHYTNETATFGFPKDGSMKIRRMSQIVPKRDTWIEKKIQMFLYNLKLEFYTHQYVHIEHGYQCDILIPVQKGITQKIIIECDGDWWHGNEEVHPRLTEAQRCQREEDYVRTKELKDAGFKVIRLWESEIKNLDLTIFKNKIGLPLI